MPKSLPKETGLASTTLMTNARSECHTLFFTDIKREVASADNKREVASLVCLLTLRLNFFYVPVVVATLVSVVLVTVV